MPATRFDEVRFCRECGEKFLLTVGQQEFFAEKGFPLPQRCEACRRIRRQQQPTTTRWPAR